MCYFLDNIVTPSHNDHIDLMPVKPMITEVNAANFRQNLGEMLNQVQYRNNSIVTTRTASQWPL